MSDNNKNKKEKNSWYAHKETTTVYLVIRFLVILALIRSFLIGEFESVFLCVMTLGLLILPSIVTRKLKVELPSTMEIIILLFIFSAEILGEIRNFYVTVPGWDTALHTLNGFCCAALGFALVDMLNRSDRFSLRLSPLYLALVAFCFSMTVGVMWEFLEFGCDQVLHVDMQKDWCINSIHSVYLDETNTNQTITVDDISDVIIVHSDGSQEALGIGGYLDVGIVDTMKDLFVNFIGAVVFSIIGYIYVKGRGDKGFASRFIPKVKKE